MNLMREILNGVWMLSESDASAMMPLVNRFLSGEQVDFSSMINQEQGYGLKQSTESESPLTKKAGVFVLPVKGVITKYDYCGSMGMMTFESYLKQLRNDDSVGAVVLDMDSGGGEASYMAHVAEALRELSSVKPVIGYFSGVCASACYYIGSQATELYASHANDMVGSIGTMVRITRPNPENKNAEYIVESIYATSSTAKNEEVEQAMKGNYALIRSNWLDPLNEQFHADVMAGRPQLSKDVLDGRAMGAGKSVEFNMVDGIKRLDQVIERAFSLIN